MKNIKNLAAAAVLSLASAAQATVLLQDNFDNEAGGRSALSFNGFSNFSVTGGSVDVIRFSYMGLSCAGNVGACVDLDGSSNAGGTLRSQTLFELEAGVYTLSFLLSGNQRGGSDTVTVSFGNVLNRSISVASDSPFTAYSFSFSVQEPTSGYLSFANGGSDNMGAMLDDVLFVSGQAVPEPSSLALLGLGLASVVLKRRRKA